MEETNDHDLLTKISTTIEIEFKNVKNDIKELKDGTTSKIERLEANIVDLKKWKEIHIQDNKDTARYNANYMKIVIGLGIALAIAIIYHITGYRI